MTNRTIPILLVVYLWLIGCSAQSQSSDAPVSSLTRPPTEESVAAALPPYVSSHEPQWGASNPAPTNVPTPPGIAEEEEEEEEDPEVEACHITAEACFSAESNELACLTALAGCLAGTEATDVGACIQAEVDCLNAGTNAVTCETQADACLEELE